MSPSSVLRFASFSILSIQKLESPFLALKGHGGSNGLHAYVHSLDDAVMDVKSFIGKVLAVNPGLPCFCFGHSTGAVIILKAALDPPLENQIAGIVLTHLQ